MEKRSPAKSTRSSAERSASSSTTGNSTKAKIIPGFIPDARTALGVFHRELSIAERHAAGRALRTKVPREAHGGWSRPADHPGAVEIILQGNKGRAPDLVPLRMARMCASPFAFYQTILDHALSSMRSKTIAKSTQR